MSVYKLIVACLMLTMPSILMAYLEPTHERMSEKAVEASILLKDKTVLSNLGIKDIKQPFLNSKGDDKDIVELFRNGARFEDSLLRPINHFFDPISGDTLLPLIAKPSPTWALEDKGSIAFPLLQRYSFADARDYLYKALTVSDETERKKHFGLTFETLGRVIHHIQDMAQPQHVRLDPHLKLSDADKPDWVFEKGSRYETYTKGLGDNLPFNTYAPVNHKDDTNYLTTARSFWHTAQGGGIGLAEFTNSNFVSAGTNFRGAFQNGGIVARPNERYPLPTPIPITPTFELANNLLGRDTPAECAPPNNPCVMAFFSSEVKDSYRQTSKVDDKASTASIFDQDLQLYGKTVTYPNLDKCTDPSNTATCEQIQTGQIFSLNRFNFDEAHKFLIPRAVAYSAGLIDYFFRGKLEAEDVTFTDSGITLKVKNAIDPQKTSAWANEILYASNDQQPSILTLAYEYKDAAGTTHYGVSNTVPMTAEPNGATGIAPGQTSQNVYSFTLSVPAEAKEVKYRLVFRGKLGQEDDAVAVGPADPVSGFVFYPTYTPADGISGFRVIENHGGQWLLTDQQNKLAGNVDWKGWHKNGRPTKVLSWVGPNSRYFPGSYDPTSPKYFGRLDTRIFQNGEVFAIAPCGVHGAALTRDSAGKEWLLVICRNGAADVVYRRPNTKSTSPTGWSAIEVFYHDPALLNPPNTPWFFNGSGTEAQTIRSGHITGDPKLRLFRLKISIADSNATFSNEGNLNVDANVGASTNAKTCSASPPVPGMCASDCSGGWTERNSSASQGTSEITWSGSNIIAVDYIQDTPVLATYTATTDVTLARQITYEDTLNNACNGRASNGACLVNTSEEVIRRVAGQGSYNTVTKIDMTGFGEIIIESTTGGFNAYYTTTDSEINNTWTTSTDKSGSGDFQFTTSRLRYLDLRYGLYSLYSTTRTTSGQTTDVGSDRGGIGLTLPTLTTIKQVTGFGGEIPVNQITLPETRKGLGIDSTFLSYLSCNESLSTPGKPQSVFMDPALVIDGGSWAVDSNKNLFGSESKLDENMKPVGYSNYLTGAPGEDPINVIPTAPPGAFYDNLGVIK